jgi:hypothetical protein
MLHAMATGRLTQRSAFLVRRLASLGVLQC